MADKGSPAPQPPYIIPLLVPPVPPVQLPAPLAQPIVPPTQPIEPGPMPQLNSSYFKPEFADKPDEDVEAHLLRTKDWMDNHAFQEGVKVQIFCLTLINWLCEARLWYESLRPVWNGIQNRFGQQHSKRGNTREHLFNVWRSFHFKEMQKH